jgi:hypothetical protein
MIQKELSLFRFWNNYKCNRLFFSDLWEWIFVPPGVDNNRMISFFILSNSYNKDYISESFYNTCMTWWRTPRNLGWWVCHHIIYFRKVCNQFFRQIVICLWKGNLFDRFENYWLQMNSTCEHWVLVIKNVFQHSLTLTVAVSQILCMALNLYKCCVRSLTWIEVSKFFSDCKPPLMWGNAEKHF